MGKKTNRWMVEVRGEDNQWYVMWMGRERGGVELMATDHERTKLGLKENQAKRVVAALLQPVTGYELLGVIPAPLLCRGIRGFGLQSQDVRIVPFRKGTWRKQEE